MTTYPDHVPQSDLTGAAAKAGGLKAGGLFIPLAAGIILRDLVTLLRVCAFGWHAPVNGSAGKILIELVVVASGAGICCKLTRCRGVAGWLVFAAGYCVLMPPLGVFDPLIGGPFPLRVVHQDGYAVIVTAVVWWTMRRRMTSPYGDQTPGLSNAIPSRNVARTHRMEGERR